MFLSTSLSAACIWIMHRLIFSHILSASWTSRSKSSYGIKSRIFPWSGEIALSFVFNDLFSSLSFVVFWLVNCLRISSTCTVSWETDAQWVPLIFLAWTALQSTLLVTWRSLFSMISARIVKMLNNWLKGPCKRSSFNISIHFIVLPCRFLGIRNTQPSLAFS